MKHVYSEFKYSNWFSYWMTDCHREKHKQTLALWHISSDVMGMIDYTMAAQQQMKSEMDLINSIPYKDKLEYNDSREFKDILHKFVDDVDKKYN